MSIYMYVHIYTYTGNNTVVNLKNFKVSEFSVNLCSLILKYLPLLVAYFLDICNAS